MLTRLVDHDDSGSLTDGTPHDNAWLQRLNDTIDGRWSIKVISATGTVNDLDIGEADFVIFTNTTDLTVTGILAPSAPAKPGKVVRCFAAAAGVVRFAYMSAGSAQANRLFTLVASGPTPILRGWAEFAYNALGPNWILVGHEQGASIVVPFAAGNFATSGGGSVWGVTAGNSSLSYHVRGTSITYDVYVAAPITGAATANLFIHLPEGFQFDAYSAQRYQPIRGGNSSGLGWIMGAPSGTAGFAFWVNPAGAGWSLDPQALLQGCVTADLQ